MFNRIAEYCRLVARPSAPWDRRSPAQISEKACGTFGPLSWRSHSPHCRHNLRSTRSSGSKKHSSLVFNATFWGWKSIRVRTSHNQLAWLAICHESWLKVSRKKMLTLISESIDSSESTAGSSSTSSLSSCTSSPNQCQHEVDSLPPLLSFFSWSSLTALDA